MAFYLNIGRMRLTWLIQFPVLAFSWMVTAVKASGLKSLDLEVAEGFAVEHVYSVPRDDQGSWISLCADGEGNLYAPAEVTRVDESAVERIQPSETSMMPEGLLNGLEGGEILDLLAWLTAGHGRANAPQP